MKNTSYFKNLKRYLPIFLLCDIVFVFIVYLVAESLLLYLINFILLFSLLSLAYIFYMEYKNQKAIKKLVYDFFENPSYEARDRLIENIGMDWENIINGIFNHINSIKQDIEDKDMDLLTYREFIEEWTHEIKSPLLISNLLLENHKDSLSPDIKDRLKYINSSFEKSIDKILFYARSDIEHSDYKIKKISIKEIIDGVLEKYYPFISEKGIIVRDRANDFTIFSDESLVSFMISQIMDNACKYTDDLIEIKTSFEKNYYHLDIIDNGKKINDMDAPFIFEKGFTGQISYKQKPTGMGLYLVKKYADDLGIIVSLAENKKESFAIRLSFPKIKNL